MVMRKLRDGNEEDETYQRARCTATAGTCPKT